MHESSADGFFAKPNDPIGFAILNNDVASLQKLHDGTYVADNPYNVSGFSEDFDNEGQFNYNFDEGYHQEFEEDWVRVVGETDNQEALRLMLQYVPDFWLCSIDFWNAFKAGYDKKLLARLLSNYPAKDDPYNNYLPWDDVSFDEVMDFLSENSSAESSRPMDSVMEAVDVPMQIFADYLNQNDIKNIDEDKLEQIITNLILDKRITRDEGNEIYNKVMDKVNQQQNAAKPIVTESTDADDDDDDKYDEEFGPVSSGNGNECVCMICGKPCGIGSFRGGSVVCPDCENRRWHR